MVPKEVVKGRVKKIPVKKAVGEKTPTTKAATKKATVKKTPTAKTFEKKIRTNEYVTPRGIHHWRTRSKLVSGGALGDMSKVRSL